ncbi:MULTISPECIES: hypothetical protein [Actinoalloteichus]|uniref:DNA-binding phage zinc finger domain-containing protein n=1 Tax=Actinoalloteichus fjordicus TaxID=1612552 RepID=A0AAC9LF75_9PSEU|nr:MULTISPECIES: hypothetical protein [Actinoalloteichus]APU15119.1 hypothetical protein UA74_15330 [Actinoalloteichus fjordicus]APU21187.1 hypothetical protein UA75_15890 [Actinoalloteichus sp. GBA129-24]
MIVLTDNQGYSLHVTALPEVHQALLAAAALGADGVSPAERKAYRIYTERLNNAMLVMDENRIIGSVHRSSDICAEKLLKSTPGPKIPRSRFAQHLAELPQVLTEFCETGGIQLGPDDAAAERHPCPQCDVPAGSACGTRAGKTAAKYHTARFILVPSLRDELTVAVPADRGPGKKWTQGPEVAATAPETSGVPIRIGYARCSTATTSTRGPSKASGPPPHAATTAAGPR